MRPSGCAGSCRREGGTDKDLYAWANRMAEHDSILVGFAARSCGPSMHVIPINQQTMHMIDKEMEMVGRCWAARAV